MTGDDPRKLIQQAFSDRPDLAREIIKASGFFSVPTAQTPSHNGIFVSIARYVSSLKNISNLHEKESSEQQDGRPTKRQRVEKEEEDVKAFPSSAAKDGLVSLPRILLSVGEISCSSPQRKKLSLDFTAEGFSGKSPADGSIAFHVRWDEIEHVICAPLPEKAQRQYNFCIFPKPAAHGLTKKSITNNNSPDAIVWTVPDRAPETATGELARSGEQMTYRSLLIGVFNARLLPSTKTVVEPDEKEFVSGIVHAHRKNEKATHVRAVRGTKDGFLYFLSTGIFWGFRKPLLFFSFVEINTISYTSVLQRTFDLVISITTSNTTAAAVGDDDTGEDLTQEYTFSMIDQEDFSAIDEYIKRHGLHDASMAEERRAKILGINGPVEGNKGEDELRNGEVELQEHAQDDDDEDEDEEGEDYDPGSEGESEGSGTSSGEDGEGHGGEEDGDLEAALDSDLEHLEDLE
ncbi:MAG: hypothetical protein M1816_007941 [Peltula sp. TS41687]|nr:MAG: hypothetical protein M1816_007941 [Peltula sp. TS41687]